MAIPTFDPEEEARQRLAEALAARGQGAPYADRRMDPQFGPPRLPSRGQRRHPAAPKESIVQQIKRRQRENGVGQPSDIADILRKHVVYGAAVKGSMPLDQFGEYGAELRKQRDPAGGWPAAGIDASSLTPEEMKILMERFGSKPPVSNQ